MHHLAAHVGCPQSKRRDKIRSSRSASHEKPPLRSPSRTSETIALEKPAVWEEPPLPAGGWVTRNQPSEVNGIPPISWTHLLRSALGLERLQLPLGGGLVTEGGVQARSVVEALDVREEGA